MHHNTDTHLLENVPWLPGARVTTIGLMQPHVLQRTNIPHHYRKAGGGGVNHGHEFNVIVGAATTTMLVNAPRLLLVTTNIMAIAYKMLWRATHSPGTSASLMCIYFRKMNGTLTHRFAFICVF